MCDVWWGAYIVFAHPHRRAHADHMPEPMPSVLSNGSRDAIIGIERRDIATGTAETGKAERRNTERGETERGTLLQSCVGSSLVFSVSLRDKYRNKVQAPDHIQGLGARVLLTRIQVDQSSLSTDRKRTEQEEKIQEHKNVDDAGKRSNDGVSNDQQEVVYTFLENTKGVVPCVCRCPTTAGEYRMIVSLGNNTKT